MKAIILAAGEGKRLQPYTLDRPKCLVPYRGKPIIDYQLEAMKTCGLADIVVVKGYRAERLERPGVRFVMNPRFDCSNMVYSLFCAEAEMNGDLVIGYGDIIYQAGILRKLMRSQAELAITVDLDWRDLWKRRMQDPLQDAETLKLDAQGRVIELGKKPRGYPDIQGQYMGLIKMSGVVLPRIREFYHRLDRAARYDGKDFDNMYMTSFLQCLIDGGFSLQSVPVRGGWLEIDSLSDLDLEPLNDPDAV